MENVLIACIPSILTGIFLAYFNGRQKKRERYEDERAAARKKESLLHLELQNATAKLALASAVALKRGKANGEVEEGVAAFNAANEKYRAFLREQAVCHLQEKE